MPPVCLGSSPPGWAWAIWWGEGHADRISAAAAQDAAGVFPVRRHLRRRLRPVPAAAAGGGLSLCAVRRRRGGAADPGLSPGPAAAPAAGAAAATAGGAGRRPAPGGHGDGGRLSQPCDPAGGKPPGHPHPGGAALRRHGGLTIPCGPTRSKLPLPPCG